MIRNSIIKEKSFNFSIRIINLYKFLTKDKREFILSKQLLRSGTSIGANIHEAAGGQSRKDFIAKLQISYKESLETEYWLNLLRETSFISNKEYASITQDLVEIIKILTKILSNSKK